MNIQNTLVTHEAILNQYYNKGGFNHVDRIGPMMRMIKEVKPATMRDWKDWYLANILSPHALEQLASNFTNSIPKKYQITPEEAYAYICDVMFKRTFSGYNKEKIALHILRNIVNPNIQEASENWDIFYFIDFYFYTPSGQLIGIQLKPVSFSRGHYENYINIDSRMQFFCNLYHAKAFILYYRQGCDFQNANQFFANPEILQRMKQI